MLNKLKKIAEPALAPSNQLILPKAVQKVLEDGKFHFLVVNTSPDKTYDNCIIEPKPNAANTVQLIALQDSIGKLQLLLPANCLIELTQLCESLGRNLQALSTEDFKTLSKKQELEAPVLNLATIPQLQEFECIADTKLSHLQVIYLHSGLKDIFIKLEGKELNKFFQHVRFENFSTTTEPLLVASESESEEQQLARAVETFTTFRIKQRLDATIEIPPMPATAEKIIKLRIDPEASIADLAKVVETDPSLAAQVVSWASSPYYGARGGITSVHDAVVRVLGFDLVINLALGLALGKTLHMPNDGPRGITPYWQQSVYCAALVEALVKRMNCETRPSIGLAYLCGLLHNFGYLILGFLFPPHFSTISRYIEANTHQPHHAIEQHVLGISREKICAWVMHLWKMPEEVATGIRWQQFPNYDGPHSQYVKVLHLANQILQNNRINFDPPSPMSNSLLQELGLNHDSVKEATSHVFEHSQDLKNLAQGFS